VAAAPAIAWSKIKRRHYKGFAGLLFPPDLICKHCDEILFVEQTAQVNTTGLTFLNIDWLSKSASVFVCQHCGKLEWFMGLGAKPDKRPVKK
jgi:hypothetical protein